MLLKIKRRKYKSLFIILLFCGFIICFSSYNMRFLNRNLNNPNIMYVHYINVDQGDSILIQVNNKNLLIDSGPKTHQKQLLNYLKALDISSLDYVIATHPHDDHIGNMSTLIDTYSVKSFYAPKIYSDTKSFEQMVESLKDDHLKIIPIKRGGDSIDLGLNTSVTVFSPFDDTYENLNNYSPVIKICFGNTSFLFTGDAESDIETKILSSNDDISADVLKIGHHGSSTSTSEGFLKKVNPKVAVISVGKYNIYNHPNNETLFKLDKYNIKTYRTDIQNNIMLISDGNNIEAKFPDI